MIIRFYKFMRFYENEFSERKSTDILLDAMMANLNCSLIITKIINVFIAKKNVSRLLNIPEIGFYAQEFDIHIC